MIRGGGDSRPAGVPVAADIPQRKKQVTHTETLYESGLSARNEGDEG